ncbi:MAG: exo-alpha-sialidase [Verrucomicrobia bacterium]|nr:exo-alpha-sialidase [Verrucomicrobiota bacterium]
MIRAGYFPGFVLLATGLTAAAPAPVPLPPGLPDPALQPARVLTSPEAEYSRAVRGAQGVPGIERARRGRLWSAWYASKSPRGVESPGSYVVVATSGDRGTTWTNPALVVAPPRLCRVYDPCLWLDPQHRLWLFWAQSAGMQDGRMGVWGIVTEEPDAAQPRWSEPRRISNGIMMNKPTVRRNGDWLLPVGLWRDNDGLPNVTIAPEAMAPYTREMLVHDLGDERGSNVIVSRDQGKTFAWLGQARVPPTRVDEHMIVERRDGTLWMLVRTTYGIGQSVSADGGRTWSKGAPYLEKGVVVPSARFFIRRLQSGALLMVRHDGRVTKTRSHLAAFVSDDDGATWKGGLMLDERDRVTYPDGMRAPDGTIHVIYDLERGTLTRDGRAGVGAVLTATFREEDARAGRAVSDRVRLRVVIDQLRPGQSAQ